MLDLFEGLSEDQQSHASNKLLGLDSRFASQAEDVMYCRANYEAAVRLANDPKSKDIFDTEKEFIEACLYYAANRTWELICARRRRDLIAGDDFRHRPISSQTMSALFQMGYHVNGRKKFAPPYTLPPSFLSLRARIERFFDFIYHREGIILDTGIREICPTYLRAKAFVKNILSNNADALLPSPMLKYVNIDDSNSITTAETMGDLVPHLKNKPRRNKAGLVVGDRNTWNYIVNAPLTSAIIMHHLNS